MSTKAKPRPPVPSGYGLPNSRPVLKLIEKRQLIEICGLEGDHPDESSARECAKIQKKTQALIRDVEQELRVFQIIAAEARFAMKPSHQLAAIEAIEKPSRKLRAALCGGDQKTEFALMAAGFGASLQEPILQFGDRIVAAIKKEFPNAPSEIALSESTFPPLDIPRKTHDGLTYTLESLFNDHNAILFLLDRLDIACSKVRVDLASSKSEGRPWPRYERRVANLRVIFNCAHHWKNALSRPELVSKREQFICTVLKIGKIKVTHRIAAAIAAQKNNSG